VPSQGKFSSKEAGCMKGGYCGRILFVDLSERKIEEMKPSEQTYRKFVGGTGLGVRFLYEKMKPGNDPLGHENILGFVTGPLTGTSAPGSGRFTVVCKSPLTNAWADSNSGGYWGPELKYAGYDAVFIKGSAKEPVYLQIVEGKAELKDATGLWGKNTRETEEILKKEVGDEKVKVACIGPSGELKSLISGIVNENGRTAARSGVGAVMGSKRLKAVVVRGKDEVLVAHPEKLQGAQKTYFKLFQNSNFQKNLQAHGTGGGLSFLVSIGDSAVRNWTRHGTEAMPTCTKLDSVNMEPFKLRRYGCHSCVVRCGAIVRVEKGEFATEGEVHRPEYETLASFGTNCSNDNIEAVIRANEICNLYGMDTIAVGNLIAFAMECYEKGLIGKKDTDGLDLSWGNAGAIVSLTEKIVRRDGFGALLADGPRAAADRIGRGAEKWAMHVCGQALPYHDPRTSPAQGTGYFADANPSRHTESSGTQTLEHGGALGDDPVLSIPALDRYGDYSKKGPMLALGAQFFQFYSSAGLCGLLLLGSTVPAAEYVAAITGWEMDWSEALRAGKRILTLRQAFNAREGIVPEDFCLPERLLPPLKVGVSGGQEIDFETMKASYFTAMGWDLKNGRPSPMTWRELGLNELEVDDPKARGQSG
jgi:aldehyde:ferredoxin oxidoreductase